jgi:hypothetical protein
MYIFIFHLNRTPLHCAASCNNLPIVKFLVEHGACIFATTISDQETAAEKCVEEEEGFDNCSDYLYSMFIFYSTLVGPSWPLSYGSWIYNYLCNQCLSQLMLWVRISIRARCTTLCKFVSDLWQVDGFLRVLWFPPLIKLTAMIELKYCWKWH